MVAAQQAMNSKEVAMLINEHKRWMENIGLGEQQSYFAVEVAVGRGLTHCRIGSVQLQVYS